MPRLSAWAQSRIPPASLRRTPIASAGQSGFEGGWQADKKSTQLRGSELETIENMTWNEGLGLSRRKGYEKVTANVAGLDVAQHCHIRNVFTSSGLSAQPSYTQQVLYYNDNDGEVWYNTLGELLQEEFDATGSDLAYSGQSIGPWGSTSTNYFRTFNINSVVWGSDIYLTALRFGGYSGASTIETHNGMAGGASKPIKYDVLNDTWTRPLPHALDGGATGFPSARCAIAYKERVFAANIYSQGVYRYATRIYWSEAGTAETWGANSWIEVGDDDGSEITALEPMGDSLAIFKDDSTWLLLGSDEDTFALHEINPQMGTRSSSATTYHQGILYFFDQSHGLMSYDGANFVNISEPINGRMLSSSFNRESDFRVNVEAFDNRIFVSLPEGADPDDYPARTYVYDTRFQQWTQWTHGIPSELVEYTTDHSHTGIGLAGSGQAYFGSPDDQIGLFRLEAVEGHDETDGGNTAITGTVRTGWITPGEIGFRHRLRRLDILTSAVNTSDIDLTLYRDFDNTTVWQSGTYDPDGNLRAWHEQNQGYDIKEMFIWLQLLFTINQDANTAADLHGWQMSTSSRPWQRGVQPSLNVDPGGEPPGCT